MVAVRQMSSDTGSEDFHHIVVAVQHEAAAAIDRAAVPDDEVAGRRRQADRLLLVHDAELHQQVGKAQRLRAVDDQAHGALFAVGADIDDGACEAVVLHAGHGNQEVIVEEAAFGVPLLSQQIHAAKVTPFALAWKARFADLPGSGNRFTSRQYDEGRPSRRLPILAKPVKWPP